MFYLETTQFQKKNSENNNNEKSQLISVFGFNNQIKFTFNLTF